MKQDARNRMQTDALDIALRHVAETKNLLGTLIVSSESFDYVQAKKTLRLLERKLKDLSKAQRELQSGKNALHLNVLPVDFSAKKSRLLP
jgi:ubiquinone/menaquinone biosynthesis C-methylase UbiE